mgnify:FL=1
MTAVKICGLTRAEDVRAAEAAGASYGGVILAEGSPRTVAPGRVNEIFAGSSLPRVGVVVNGTTFRVIDLVEQLQCSVPQLQGDEPPNLAGAGRRRTRAEVWKAVAVRSSSDFQRAVETYEGFVDGLLLDGWSPNARGGTGARFPWEEVAEVRGRLQTELRLVVAGGLNATNVVEIVDLLTPDVVDVSSGVERAPGIKDENLIRSFAEAARSVTHNGVG